MTTKIIMTTRAAAARIRRPLAMLGVAATLITPLARTLAAQEAGIPLGTAAPGAPVTKLDGTATDLAQYIGKGPVVLEFWATWCPLCRKLEPAMHAAQEKYKGRVTFVGVGVSSNQTADRQAKYVAEKQLGGEFVFDQDGKAVAAYHAPHTSYVVVLDAKGKVVYTGVGSDQDIDAAVAHAFAVEKSGDRPR